MRCSWALSVFFLIWTLPAWSGNISVPKEIPTSIVEQVRSRAASDTRHGNPGAIADLYLCDPYCEIVGQFLNPEQFKVTAASLLSQVQLPENLNKLQLLFAPAEILKVAPTLTSNSLGKSADPTGLPIDPAVAAAEESSESADAKDGAKDAGSGAREKRPTNNDDFEIVIGTHLNFLASARSLSTSANIDTTSDSNLHAVLGGGFEVELKNIATAFKYELSIPFEVTYLSSLSETSANPQAGEPWSSSRLFVQTGTAWQRPTSQWKYSLILEARADTENAFPDSGIGFSSNYTFLSAGPTIQYKETKIQILQSVYSQVQDVSNYRGPQIAASRLDLNVVWCQQIKKVWLGAIKICPTADYMMMSVAASGTPSQPAFTQNSTFAYSEWSAGFQLRYGGITF